jgi:UDP-N-acetylglucosamine 2-epimerase (non-hydrolysing)
MMKILCVVGTRPEVIKVAPVILGLRARPDLAEVRVVATAQHRHLLDQMMGVFGIRADEDLDVMRENQTLADVTCRVLQALCASFRASRPDLVLAQGDTTTVMAAAMACFYTHTTFGHIEAGLRTGDRWAPYPEEFNRRVAALAARHHFAPTPQAGGNLVREGVDPTTVYVTGNTVIDALQHVLAHTRPPPSPLPPGAPYVLMTCHRREIFGAPVREVFEAVRDFAAARPGVHVWYPVHPNPNVSGPAREILGKVPNVVLSHPLDYVEFLHAMSGAHLLLTDSGGVQEEAPSLGKPVLVLRDVTERPEGVAAGTCRLVGPHRERIAAALDELFDDPVAYRRMAQARNPYGDGRAADRIISIIEGRTPPACRLVGIGQDDVDRRPR